MHVQSCCFASLNLLLFCRSRCRRRRRCVNSLIRELGRRLEHEWTEHSRSPWAHPDLTGIVDDDTALTSTPWCRVVSHCSSHVLRFPWIPQKSYLFNNRRWAQCRMPLRCRITTNHFVDQGQGYLLMIQELQSVAFHESAVVWSHADNVLW